MEPTLPVQPLPIPSVLPITPPIPVPTKPQFHLGLVITIIIIIILAVAGYFSFPYLLRLYARPSSATLTLSPSPTVSPPISVYPPVENASNSLVYIRMVDPNKSQDLQAWIIDPATGKEQALPLKDFAEAYKYYGSSKLFYKPIGEKGEYRILDLKTGIEQSYLLITHPDPSAMEGVNVNNITEISPDGKYLVFQAGFNTPCSSPSPFPSGFEGDFGPCGPGESLETPSGYYLYDFDARKATHLGSLIRTSRWDPVHHKLYYVDYEQGNSTKALDLPTKTTTYVDSTTNFGYFTYPLLQSNKLVKQEGATGNSGAPAFSNISLLDLPTQKSVEIAKADDWAIIQPFVFSSPNDQNIIYVRTNLVGDGIRRFSLFLYSITDKKSTELTPGDNTVTYSTYADWIDDHTLVTSVDTIEATNYTNTNNYLVKIDITTGKITRLTPHDQVYRFNYQ